MAATVNVEVKAQVDDAVRGLGQLNKSFDLMKNANRDAAGALGVFGVSLTALNSPLTAIASGIKDSIDTTVKWGETIDKLSRSTGQSAEETSKMAVVLGDFGINVDSLDKVVKTFTKNGLQFNMATLKDLAKQYQAIQDPVERDKFAFDNFGRSAMDMTEILSKTPAELEAVGNAAMVSGKIMSEQGVEAAQKFGVQIKQLNDQLDGLKIEVGGPLVDGLSTAITAFTNLKSIVSGLAIIQQRDMHLRSEQELGIRAAAAAAGDLWAGTRKLTDAEDKQLTALLDVADAFDRRLAPAIQATDYSLLQHTEDSRAAEAADNDLAVSLGNAAIAAQRQTDALTLQAGLSGTITKSQDDYSATLDANAKDIDKLTTEIAKYQALQGQTITTVTKGSATQEDYNLAVQRAAIAHQRLAEYHGKSEASLMSLTLSVQQADDRVSALTGKLGSASTTTADYTTKINEDQAALDALNAKNAEAADAIAKTTAQFIYQQEVALIKDPAVLLEVARRLGLVDEASYNLSKSVLETTHQFDLNNDGMLDAGKSAKDLADALGNTEDKVLAADGVIPPLTGHFEGMAGAAYSSAAGVYSTVAAIDQLHDKTVTINVNTVQNGYFEGSVGNPGRASGGPVRAGRAYTVGEEGIETFVPSQDGMIVNNYNTTHNTVNAAYGGSASPGAVAREMRLMSKLNK